MSERQLLAAIVRWLRANGFDAHGRNTKTRRGIGWDTAPSPWIEVFTTTVYGGRAGNLIEAYVESTQQAADLLVIIGILPVEFASWTPAECDIWDETALVSAVRR